MATGTSINFAPGDQFLLVWAVFFKPEEFFTAIHQARRAGAAITFLIHDLRPIADTLLDKHDFNQAFFIWWSQVLRFADRLVTVSRKVSRDVACYVTETSMAGLVPTRPLPVAYFALGCDALQRNRKAEVSLPHPVDRNTLVAAGTLMKHKRVTELVTAMQILWAEGCEMRLMLPGGEVRKSNIRADLSSLPDTGSKLFLPGYISDTELAETMSRCSALVCASNDEGFGLPLVEAASLRLPIIARDIEIFRETSGGDAFFFEDGDAGKIAQGLRKWLALTRQPQLKFVPKKSLVTWQQSAEMLKAIMFNGVSSFSLEVGLKATVNLAVPDTPKETFNHMNRPLLLLLGTGAALGLNFPLGKLAMAEGISPALWAAMISAGDRACHAVHRRRDRAEGSVAHLHPLFCHLSPAFLSYVVPNVLTYSVIPQNRQRPCRHHVRSLAGGDGTALRNFPRAPAKPDQHFRNCRGPRRCRDYHFLPQLGFQRRRRAHGFSWPC